MYTVDDVKFITEISNKDICNLKVINLDDIIFETLQRAWVKLWLSTNRINSIFEKPYSFNINAFAKNTILVKSFIPSSSIVNNTKGDANKRNFKTHVKSTDHVSIVLKFFYEDNVLNVKWFSIRATNSDLFKTEDYTNAIDAEIALVNKKINDPSIFTQKMLICCLFETLYDNNVSIVTGEDAENLWEIYVQANKHFPEFSTLPLKRKLQIFQRAFFYAANADSKDIHSFAKEVFHVLHDKNLISKFIFNDIAYTLVNKIHRELIRSGKKTKVLQALSYKSSYSRASFSPFDLWSALANSTENE